MGIIMVEFASDGDTALFSDFARRMGAKVDFRFGTYGFDSVGFVGEKLCGCGSGRETKEASIEQDKDSKKAGGFFKKNFKNHKK